MLTLDAISIGQKVRMVGFNHPVLGFRHKLLAMGFTPGVEMTIMCIAPLGDPVQIQLRGYSLSLRKKECQQIEVEYINAAHFACHRPPSPSHSNDCTCR